MPAGLVDGINYNSTDPTKASVRCAFKDFIYVQEVLIIGSLQIYAMKKDPKLENLVELTGLVSEVNYSYQYWVGETTPLVNSPL
jgi:hypothetical protein